MLIRWLAKHATQIFNGIGFRAWLKDWRSGFDEQDLQSVRQKMLDHGDEPGGHIHLSHREMAALRTCRWARVV